MIRIAILGAGNVGHALASLLGSRPEFDVVLWGRHLSKPVNLELCAFGPSCIYAIGSAVTEPSIRRAVENADIVVLAVPAHVRHGVLEQIAQHVGRCALLLSWEGMGGFSDSVHGLGITGPSAVGLQRSPVICRTRRVGRSVEILGVRSQVVAAPVEPSDLRRAAQLMNRVFPFHFRYTSEYACVSLSPGNPLIHSARLYSCADVALDRPKTRFYADWSDSASRILLDLHHELAELRDALDLPAKFMRTLVDAATAPSTTDVTRDIRSELRLSEILLPVRAVRNRWELDRTHRFFREDIGEGLTHILLVAHSKGVHMPTAEAICNWQAKTALGRRL